MSNVVYKFSGERPQPLPAQRDAMRTKALILDAAVELFASRGYSDTGIRTIADRAGVNSALVGRYFGTKEELFAIALERSLGIASLLTLDRATYGEAVVEIFFKGEGVPNPLTMIILSSSDPAARAISVDLLQKMVIAPLAKLIGGPDAVVRAMQLNMLWNGFHTSWSVLRLEALSGANLEATAKWLAAMTQATIDGKLP